MERMTLIPDDVLPELLAAGVRALEDEKSPPSAKALVKLFDPCGRYTLYVFEAERAETVFADGPDLILYGFCVSPLGEDCDEWGYASLAEIAATRNRLGLYMERDTGFRGVTRAEIVNGARP